MLILLHTVLRRRNRFPQQIVAENLAIWQKTSSQHQNRKTKPINNFRSVKQNEVFVAS
jgi:hypothetical protein